VRAVTPTLPGMEDEVWVELDHHAGNVLRALVELVNDE
jgi:hypothetical protein